jgi:CRP-like cAMP-binding protein
VSSGDRSDVSRIRGDLLYRALEEAGLADAHLGAAKPQVWAGMLADVPLFSKLGKRDLRRVASAAQVARVAAGQVIVREGFSAEAFYVLLTGAAAVRHDAEKASELARGDVFGELGLLDGAPRTASVVATRESWVMKLPRREFLVLLDSEPSITRGLLEGMVERVRTLESRLAARPQA